MKKYNFYIILLLVNSLFLFAQKNIKIAEEEIKNKNFENAIVILNNELKKDSKKQEIYLLLGIAYRELQNFTKAEGAFLSGISMSGEMNPLLYFELGNLMFKRGSGYLDFAIKYYSMAIDGLPNYEKALLNRANSYVERGKVFTSQEKYTLSWQDYRNAIQDYSQYLFLNSQSNQIENIGKMIEILRKQEDNLKQKAIEREREIFSAKVKANSYVKDEKREEIKENSINYNDEKSLESKNSSPRENDNYSYNNREIKRNSNDNKLDTLEEKKVNKFLNEIIKEEQETQTLIELKKVDWQEELNLDE